MCYLAARLVGYDPCPCLLLKVCLLLSLAKSFISPAYSFHIPALFHGARLLLVYIDAALHVNIRLQGGRDGMWSIRQFDLTQLPPPGRLIRRSFFISLELPS